MKKIIKYLVIFFIIFILIFILIISYRKYSLKLKEREHIYQEAFNLDIIDETGKINITESYNLKEEKISELKENLGIIIYDEKEIENLILKLRNNINNFEKTLMGNLKIKEELEEKKANLEKQYQILYKKYQEKQNSHMLKKIYTISQYPKYPTGCESVALAILLKYYNYDISVDDIISKLKKGKKLYEKEGKLYGGNPELEFVGNPYEKDGFGVYEKPILDVAKTYDSRATSNTGISLNEILKEVKKNNPVMVWISYNLTIPYISEQWYYEPTMELIKWKSGEHAVVIIGYTSNQIIVSDPYDGKIKYYDKKIFENRYNYFGRKNIYIEV